MTRPDGRRRHHSSAYTEPALDTTVSDPARVRMIAGAENLSTAKELSALAERAAELGREGLTSGMLTPQEEGEDVH